MILTLDKYIADIEEIFISQVAFIPPAESFRVSLDSFRFPPPLTLSQVATDP